MTAPFSAYATTGVAIGYEPLYSGRLVTWDIAGGPAPIPLSIITASVSEDEEMQPRVRVEATVARTSALDELDMELGWMFELTTGYRWAATGAVEQFVTHERIMLRHMVPIIGAGTSELVAVGAESILIDAADEDIVAAAATFRQYMQALVQASLQVVPPGSTFYPWWYDATSMPDGLDIWDPAAMLRAVKMELPAPWAEPMQAACEANSVEWFCTRLGVLTIRPLPTPGASPVFAFTDGPGGTVTAYRPGVTLDDYANDVWVNYSGNVTGHNAGLKATGRRVSRIVNRENIVATAAVANEAASSIRQRLSRYTGTATLDAALVLWLKAGDPVTVSVDGAPAVPYIVQNVSYRFPQGDMTLTLRNS